MFLTLLIKATKSSLSGLQLASHWVWQGNRCGSWHAPWQVQWWWTHRCGLDVTGGRQHWMATLLVEVGSEWGVSEGVIRSWVHSWDCSSMSRFSFYKHKNTGIKQRCSALYSVHCTAEVCWLVTKWVQIHAWKCFAPYWNIWSILSICGIFAPTPIFWPINHI